MLVLKYKFYVYFGLLIIFLLSLLFVNITFTHYSTRIYILLHFVYPAFLALIGVFMSFYQIELLPDGFQTKIVMPKSRSMITPLNHYTRETKEKDISLLDKNVVAWTRVTKVSSGLFFGFSYIILQY